MPDTPYLIAAVVVPVAVVLAVWVARHLGGEPQGTTAGDRSALAATRAELAAARSRVDQLTEQLRQAQAVETVHVPAHADGRHVEVFVNLSRRLQSLVHREIKLLDALENEVEDPDLLKGLFQVDHLATRIRRHAENLAVLGGSVSRRQWSRPVALTEVLRSAVAEVEHYSRVKLVPPIEGTLPGHAVASVIHLIAELIENATMFAPPHTQVLLRAQQVAAGVAVEVEDRGLGMLRADLDRVNRLLANPEDTNLDDLLRDGRIGIYVVSMIARQHGIVVQLQTNIYGGTQAVVVLPQMLIGSPPAAAPEAPAPQSPAPAQERAVLQKRIPIRERPRSHAQDTPTVSPQLTWPLATPKAGSGPGPVPRQHAGVPVAGRPAPPARPPLPRRRSQTHMAPQLQLGAPRPASEPAGEHEPGLMASFMNGVAQGEADPPGPGRHG